MAELVTRIAESQPASIGIDLYFPEPDRFSPGMIADELPILPTNLANALRTLPSNDQLLADAIRGRNVVLGIAADLPDPRFPEPPRAAPVVTKGERAMNLQVHMGHIGNVPPLEEAAAGRGLMNSGQHDQVVRVIPLISRVQGATVPALSVETFRVALDTGMRIEDGPLGLLTLRIAETSTPMHEDGTTYLRMGRYDEARPISAYE